MTNNRAELIAAEAKVMEGLSELTRLKNEVQNLERDGADVGAAALSAVAVGRLAL